VLPTNGTLLEWVFTVLLTVATPLTFFASLRAWRRTQAVKGDRLAERAAAAWFRARFIISALVWLTLWAAILALYAPPPRNTLEDSANIRRAIASLVILGLIADVVLVAWEDREYARDIDPLTEARLLERES